MTVSTLTVPICTKADFRKASEQTNLSGTLQVPHSRTRAISSPGPPRLGLQLPAHPRPRTRDSSPNSQSSHVSSPHLSHMPSFSLIGALEFRRVVSSLQEQAAGTRLSLFESPMTPYPGGHYTPHRFHSLPTRTRTPLALADERDPWDAALGVPLDTRSPQVLIDDVDSPDDDPVIPMISHTPASPVSSAASDTETEVEQFVPPSRRRRFFRVLGMACHILFPTLRDFRSKSILGMIASLFAAPAVMALTLTLPVVVTDHHGVSSPAEKLDNAGGLVEFEEEGTARALIAEEEVQSELHELKFNKWLMAVQCALGPLFCVAILFGTFILSDRK